MILQKEMKNQILKQIFIMYLIHNSSIKMKRLLYKRAAIKIFVKILIKNFMQLKFFMLLVHPSTFLCVISSCILQKLVF